MHYDFDQVHNRFHTDSIKWDRTEKLFGDKDILPMWIADMDFHCPLPVIERLISRAEHGIFGYTARSDSYFESGGEGFTRVNIACPRSVLEEGLQRMASAVHKWVQ